ncbi:MAG TPA: hypothetical protein VK327_03520, partial [Candidatus Paceibacterota bacterium]|nr:hypothetical protein [Candidatus Paceibacterota bacterium]
GKRLPIDKVKMAADMPKFQQQVRQTRRQEAINMWIQREGSKSLRETPLMQPKPSLVPGGQAKS